MQNPPGLHYVKQDQDNTKLSASVFIALTVHSESGVLWIQMHSSL